MGRMFALSVKQPWATLLARGLKAVEVRRWPTARRERVLIHAARVPDGRPHGWSLVPSERLAEARRVGGLVGAVTLTGCVKYESPAAFAADGERHLNDPAWFVGPALYGFVFADPEALPFRPYSGGMRFFKLED